MSSPVHTIHESERLTAAHARMTELGVAALPVVDDTGQVGSVLTAEDLLRIGRMRVAGGLRRTLALPDSRVSEHASGRLEVVGASASLADAARRMVGRRVHHVFVTQDRRPGGVLATRDLMRAIAEARVATPVAALAPRTPPSVLATDPLSLAVDRFVSSARSVVVVLDGRAHVIGVFGPREALAAKDATPGSPTEEWASRAFLRVPSDLPLHHAAAEAAVTEARVLIVMEGGEALGAVTGHELAAAVAEG